METFRAALKSAKNIIVVAGAGLSAASGIPTFRDGGGLWRSLDAMSLATPYAFEQNPSLVWQFYHYRRIKALEALPNPAHRVLAKLCVPDRLKLVAPSAESFHLITQNIDGLSIRALQEVSAELGLPFSPPDPNKPSSIFEMHGRLFDIKCTECDYCKEDRSIPLCPALGRADDSFKDVQDAGTRPMDIPETELPRCPACGSLARPGIVWFYEIPLYLDQIQTLVENADMCLVIGTSSTVYPAAGYASIVKSNGGKVAVFNLDPDADDRRRSDWVFAGGCESVLPSVFPELG